jgi:hypothetical protein
MSPRLLSSCFVLCVILYVAGCNTQTSLPISITVSPQSAAITPGQTVRFAATVNSQMTDRLASHSERRPFGSQLVGFSGDD